MDFSLSNTTIQTGSGLKPVRLNTPLDIRTVVNKYSEIATIPNPFVGMNITVLADETNSNKMTDYKVKTLKANSLGMMNTVINEVVRMSKYLNAVTPESFTTVLNYTKVPSKTRTVQIPEYDNTVIKLTIYVNACIIKNYTRSNKTITFGFDLDPNDIVAWELLKVVNT